MNCYGYCALVCVTELSTGENQNSKTWPTIQEQIHPVCSSGQENLHFRPLASGLYVLCKTCMLTSFVLSFRWAHGSHEDWPLGADWPPVLPIDRENFPRR